MVRRKRKKGSRDLLEAKRQFEAQGLPFPYIPQEMQTGFHRMDKWIFGLGRHGRDLYDIEQFKRDALTRPAGDFLLLGQAGQENHSYAMHYYVARNPLYLFLQIDYVGAYTDSAEAVKSMTLRYEQAEMLIKILPGAVRKGLLLPEERWVIADSDLNGASWFKTYGYEKEDAVKQELDEPAEVLRTALDWLEASLA
jgi:hypothetical protein